MNGYISLHRKIFDNDLWKEKPFDRARAWIDLLLLANHKDKQVLIKNKWFDCKRGELVWSMKSLADRWGWSVGKVKRFLECLENGTQIEYKNNNLTTCISIINYDKYQSNGTHNETQTENKWKTNGKQTETNNKDNNDNKIISSRFSPPTIDDVSAYFEQRGVSEDIARKESSKFINHYQSVGWSVGKSKMKDWKAAVRGWIDRGELIKEKQMINKNALNYGIKV